MVHLTSVKLRRLDQGLTRAELAARAGLKVPRLVSIEEGKVPLTAEELLALARALRVEATSLAEHDRLTVDVVPPRISDRGSATSMRAKRREGELPRGVR